MSWINFLEYLRKNYINKIKLYKFHTAFAILPKELKNAMREICLSQAMLN